MKPRFRKYSCVLLALIMVIALVACGNDQSLTPKETDDPPSETTKATPKEPSQKSDQPSKEPDTATEDKNNITSVEAAKLAYEEAKKWNANAVLWYISPTIRFLHYDWANTDKASSWTIGFSNPDNDEQVLVYIRNGAIFSYGNTTYDNVGNKRDVECKAEYPKDSPIISMKDAVQAAISNGAPAGVMPSSVTYDIESFGEEGAPLWMFVYRLPVSSDSDEDEMHFYYVDGLTGELVKAGYKAGGEVVDKQQLTVTGPDYSSSAVYLGQDVTIVKFLTLINEGKTDEALQMMDKAAVPDEATKKTLTDSYNCIRGFTIDSVVEDNEDNWTADTQMYEVELTVSANKDLQKYGWMEGENVRYVTMVRQGNNWMIGSFSFQ